MGETEADPAATSSRRVVAAEGEAIGRYQLQGIVGTGAFATVYEALDEGLEQTVAIKVLAENHASNPEMRERFVREAQAIRKVSHGAIITIHDIGETSRGQPYLVTELLPGGDLAHRLAALQGAGRAISSQDLRELIAFLASAMTAVHNHDLVHRDISPGNILLRATLDQDQLQLGTSETFVLGDFGLVKDLAAASGLTVGAGTPGFSAPEQRVSHSIVDHRADLYGASAVVAAVAEYADSGAAWQQPLGAVLAVGMSAEISDRPDDAEAWRRSLLAALSEGHGPDGGGEGPASSPARARRLPAAGIAAAAIAIGVMATLVVWSQVNNSDDSSNGDETGGEGADSAQVEGAIPVAGAGEVGVFDDELAPGWFDQSWGATSLSLSGDGYRGAGINADLEGWGAISLASETAVSAPPWITFWVKTTGANPQLAIRLNDAAGEPGQPCLLRSADLTEPGTIGPTWTRVQFSLDRFPTPSSKLTRISIIDLGGESLTLEIDELELATEPPNASNIQTGCIS